jgi:hypothetical protein
VEGLDTPYHNAIMRARDHALEKYAAYLAQSVGHYVQQRNALTVDEADWAKFWAQQCQECQLAMQ